MMNTEKENEWLLDWIHAPEDEGEQDLEKRMFNSEEVEDIMHIYAVEYAQSKEVKPVSDEALKKINNNWAISREETAKVREEIAIKWMCRNYCDMEATDEEIEIIMSEYRDV